MKAEEFFTSDQQQAIANAIAAVEQRTAGEIAVMVVDESDSYPEGRILAGVLLGGLAGLVATDSFFHDSLWYFVPLWAGLAVVIGWLTGFVPPLKRMFVPRRRRETEVRLRAVRAFYEKGLYKTRDNSGVLFFLSLFEHKVWILADEGIYAKIAPESLQAYAADIARGVREGRAAAVLCREIENVGVILAEHFPVRPDDVNELPDTVLTEAHR